MTNQDIINARIRRERRKRTRVKSIEPFWVKPLAVLLPALGGIPLLLILLAAVGWALSHWIFLLNQL